MAIGDVMRTRVVTVEPGDSARLAVLRMLEESVGSVAVCDGGRLVGIFNERDVLALAGDGTDLDAVNVGDVMTRDPVTVDADVQILDAARLMGERRIRSMLTTAPIVPPSRTKAGVRPNANLMASRTASATGSSLFPS